MSDDAKFIPVEETQESIEKRDAALKRLEAAIEQERRSYLPKMQAEAHAIAVEKGFWIDIHHALDPWTDSPLSSARASQLLINEKLTLIHSEVTEAHEEVRKGTKQGFGEELADVVIRVLDLAAAVGIDLTKEINDKMEKNKARPYKHGKRF